MAIGRLLCSCDINMAAFNDEFKLVEMHYSSPPAIHPPITIGGFHAVGLLSALTA